MTYSNTRLHTLDSIQSGKTTVGGTVMIQSSPNPQDTRQSDLKALAEVFAVRTIAEGLYPGKV